MPHIPTLISDLAVILICAGLVTILFKWLKQPVVLGYIVAGILAGPSIDLLPTVSDTKSIQTWAEIGVIFLLFALGLDFSFKKLIKIGGTATIAATTIVIGMMTFGYLTGMLMGWGHMNSLFLGGMISISSTTIVFKAFNDMGLSKQRFAGVVLGVLIVEDLFAILLMLLLSTLAISKQVEGGELFGSVMKLGGFLLFWFVVGIFVLPPMLKKWRKHLNDETLLIVSLALCLGMVIIAIKVGFSAALGAFVMGSILAETLEAERIERVMKPITDLFGAIFFVSVGMLIEPSLLWEYKFPILLVTVVVMAGQLFFSTFGILLSGQPLKIAIQSGFSLVQIGEFAFIIASLGVALGVTDSYLYPIVVAVSVITTFLTPYMIRLAEPAYCYVEKKLPMPWIHFIERYSSASNTIRQKSTWGKLLRTLLRITATYLAVCIVAIFAWVKFVHPSIESKIPGIAGEILSLVLILLIIVPILRAIIMKKNSSAEFQELWNAGIYNRCSLVLLVILRIIICIVVLMLLISHLLNATTSIGLVIATVIIGLVIYSRRLMIHSIKIEKRFFSNLSAREKDKERRSPVTKRFVNHLLERDIHLADFEVEQQSHCVGKTLRELNFRQICNVNVVTIVRGKKRINLPSGETRIYPFDKLVVVGSDSDLTNFTKYVETHLYHNDMVDAEKPDVNLEQFTITECSELIGLSIIQSGIRDHSTCIVVGIERGETSIKNPAPTTVFELNDVVWIVGEHDKAVSLSEGRCVK